MSPSRPVPEYETGPVTRTLRIAAVLGAAALTVYILWRYPSLPEVVPMHFNFSGEADDLGSRTSVLWLAGIMTAMSLLLAWLSTRPHRFNYPGDITEANAQRMYREGERMMVWALAAIVVVYLGIVVQIFAGAGAGAGAGADAGGGGGAGAVILVVGMIAIMASTLAGIARMVIADTPGKH